MNNFNPYQAYQQQAVAGADRGELTLMLFNGAVRFIRQGGEHIAAGNIAGAHRAIVRGQEIIAHLRSTLNMDYELAHNLDALYEFIHRLLVEANVKKDGALLGQALELVEQLRDAWAQAVKTVRTTAAL